MAKDLYLMRHGETLFNVRRKIQGWCDSPLTEKGIEQARAAGRLLRARNVTLDRAYASTAERASDTLELVLGEMGQAIPYERVKDLRERYFAVFEGESEDLNPTWDYDELFPRYGGETSSQVSARMHRALSGIMAREGSDRVLAVSHAGACYAFLANLGNPMDVLGGRRIGNCAILHFGFEDGAFSLIEYLDPLEQA